MANLSFNIELTSTIDTNRTLVSKIGRAIIKKLAVKFEGNEIMSVNDFDVLACYQDLWKTKSEKKNAIWQGIFSSGGCTTNCIRLRINACNKDASNAQDKAISSIGDGGTSSLFLFMATLTLQNAYLWLHRPFLMKLPNVKMLLRWPSRMHIYGFIENRTFWSNLLAWGYQLTFPMVWYY